MGFFWEIKFNILTTRVQNLIIFSATGLGIFVGAAMISLSLFMFMAPADQYAVRLFRSTYGILFHRYGWPNAYVVRALAIGMGSGIIIWLACVSFLWFYWPRLLASLIISKEVSKAIKNVKKKFPDD